MGVHGSARWCDMKDMQHTGFVQGADVTVRVPPYSEYLRTVRLVAADVGARAALDVDEVEDFRIAIDELSNLLMRSTDHELEIAFGCVGDAAVAHGRARRREGANLADLDDLSRKILVSVADWFETGASGEWEEFAVVKRPWARAMQA
jgi:hypothetical protein